MNQNNQLFKIFLWMAFIETKKPSVQRDDFSYLDFILQQEQQRFVRDVLLRGVFRSSILFEALAYGQLHANFYV
jgi:hypothetical protein